MSDKPAHSARLALATIEGHGAPARALFYGTEASGYSTPSRMVRIESMGDGWYLLTPLNGDPQIEVAPNKRVWLFT